MKVKIGPYKNWIGPYQIAEALCFWVPKVEHEYGIKDKPEWVHNFGSWLAGGDDKDSLLMKACTWIESKRKRTFKVKIDRWDTWSMDSTLAPIILPMLKQLQETKHGSAVVDLEDVPESMRTVETEDWDEQLVFDFYTDKKDFQHDDIHTRWSWILSEMIFAFEHKVDDSWEDAYRSGVIDYKSVPCAWDDQGKPTMYTMENGPNHTYKCDYEGMKKIEDRMQNGFRLFGKYYQNLWN